MLEAQCVRAWCPLELGFPGMCGLPTSTCHQITSLYTRVQCTWALRHSRFIGLSACGGRSRAEAHGGVNGAARGT